MTYQITLTVLRMQPLGKPLVLALFACNSKTGYMISISRYIFLENFGKKIRTYGALLP